MIQPKKPNIIRVSRSHSHRYFTSSIKKRRSNNVIHRTIGIPKLVYSTHNNLHSIFDERSKITTSTVNVITQINRQDYSLNNTKENGNLTQKSSSPTSHLIKMSGRSRSSKVTHHEDVINIHSKSQTELLDERGMTNDYHQKSKRNKKLKCSRRCFIVSLVATLLFLLIIAAILLALFIKPQTTTTPSNIPVLRWNTAGITVAGIVGNPGVANNQLNTPYDITFDYANNLYIADRVNSRIQKYLFGNSIGSTAAGNASASSSQNQLNNPSAVIIDSNQNLYISDTFNSRVQFWSYGASSGTTVASGGGIPSIPFSLNSGIALDRTSNILYVLDRLHYRVISVSSGSTNGTLVFGGNGTGINNTQLSSALGIYLDSLSNSLLIANYGANNIVRYVFGASVWTLVAGNINGSSGATSTSLNSPNSMTLDPMGNIYVADTSNQRIQFFYAGQATGSTIAGISGVIGNDTITFNTPRSVRLDSQLNLYVADANNHRIQKFLRY